MPRVKVTKQDWLRAALVALAESGIGGVAVSPLARRLGVTRGSFYWYFRDRAELVRQALELWENEETIDVIAELSHIDDPIDRLHTLIRRAFTDDDIRGLEPAIVAHANDHLVKEVLERVNRRRLDYLTEILEECGLDRATGRRHAVATYATYLGWIELRRATPDVAPETAPSMDGDSGAAIEHLMCILTPTGRST